LPRAWSPVDPNVDESEPAVPESFGESVNNGVAPLEHRGDYRIDGPAHRPSAEALDTLSRRPALQLHNRYLIAETTDGMAVIDQHALHERVLYEQLRDKVLAAAVETQSLLVPEPVDLAASEAALVLEHRELLARLGVQVEPFGGGTVLIVGYPAMLANLRPVEILRGLVEQLATGSRQPERRDLLDELLHMVACKAAIKAGDRLTPEEVHALLEMRGQLPDTHHCPHGRPTELVFTREELDRQFKRT
jgi:DNA mismatch repair protein MutL